MITPLLKHSLEPIVARQRLLRTLRGTALAIIAAAVLAALGVASGFVLILTLIALWLISRVAHRWTPDYRGIARRVEARHPELHALLLTAVEQQPDPATGRLSFLQQRVLAEAAAEARKHQWVKTVPGWTVAAHMFAVVAAFALLGWTLFGLDRVAAPVAQHHEAPRHDGVEVTPGDVSIERGSGLVVLASFGTEVPSEATLVIQPENGPEQRIPLVKNLDDPVFGGGLPEVDAGLAYRVDYGSNKTRNFKVQVYEHPRLERADATLHFPEYTKVADKQVLDTRRVSAVEGTKLDVAFQLNKPVKSARLVAKDGTEVPLTLEAGQPTAALRGFNVAASNNYELKLEDADGRVSKVPAQIAIEALPNRVPELKFAAPKGDQRVSPLQEVAFRAEAWDDFGIARYGMTFNVAGRGEQHIELGTGSGPDERRQVAHLLKLEELGVKPDELISWFLWAEDTGPDGKPRRTASDMFFGEIRPLEEIFRPGDSAESEQQQQQQGGAAREAMKLAELQKQVISATWNLKRTEESAAARSPTSKYLEDVPVVRDSQGDALKLATALEAKAEDPKAKALVGDVTREMRVAVEQLTAAAENTEPLPQALAAEQGAYNALLKLAAHTFRVSRSQQSSSAESRSAQQRQQQQLDELDLKDEKKRYETKRQATPEQDQQQREELAVLNRLKELAQRQQDINEQLQELQTALQAAQSEKEKEEIKRQLKRLREEEQQLLSDLDETRQKMEQSPQQAQLGEERRKLDETRSEAQKAAESLEKGATSQALASGTRAAKNLEEMRDEFRMKTSGQFNEDMRQMRTEARELAQRQQEIADKLNVEAAKPERKTLSGDSKREQLAQQFEKQRGSLAQLTGEMKRVSEQAEAAEPLLAKELYETLRKTAQAETGRKLEMTQQLAERGYGSQAQKFEEKARAEIAELTSGVERAAESVLGDEAEALRQARAELDALTEQLNRELAKARPDLAKAEQSGPRSENASQPGAAPEGAEPGAPQDPGAAVNDPAGQAAGTNPADQNAATHPGFGERRPGNPGARQGQGNEPGAEPGRIPQGPQRGSAQGGQTRTAQKDGQGQPPGEGERPGQGRGEGQQSAQASGQGQRGAQTAQRNQQNGQQGQQAGRDGGPNQQPGRPAPGASPNGGESEGQGGEQSGQTAQGNPTGWGARRSLRDLAQAPRDRGGIRTGGNEGESPLGGGNEGEQTGPLTGQDFAAWADRLRKVEEMVDDPGLRAEAARVREVAKGMRVEFKRHSVPPNWEVVKTKISTPLTELRNRLTEELARRESKENLVPIDRDPVPPKYAERVRRYYEELGRSAK